MRIRLCTLSCGVFVFSACGKGTAGEKIAALESAHILVAQGPADLGEAAKRAMGKK